MGRVQRLLAMAALALAPNFALAQNAGLDAWTKIHEILSHPRCANCHVGPDHIPVWNDPKNKVARQAHGMNISGGASRKGEEYIPCASCHTHHNSPQPKGPPGAHNWALPPVSMQWIDKTSAEICAQIKDPARNGGRSVQQIIEHVEKDELVHWGWAPGPGREPAPYSVAEAVAFLKAWAAADAPCPAN
jgi:diadenosine tetraphosphatase ApaH/serine/threonine PP2A family protein phosphatase